MMNACVASVIAMTDMKIGELVIPRKMVSSSLMRLELISLAT